MPLDSRLRAGVTLSVMVNLAGASAAVFSAAVAPAGPVAERFPDAAPVPTPAVAAFVASAPVAWAAPPVAPPAAPPSVDAAAGVDVDGGDDLEPDADVYSGDGATVDVEAPVEPSDGNGERLVSSTGYCLDGTTADGGGVGAGGVAMNGVPLGSSWRVLDGSLAGSVLTVNDRIGHSSEFDIWFDDCDAAAGYGRQTIAVVPES